ncbi:hypothetical protein HOK021_21970 [Streptomyces hygroscopicus]|nr:hypothetical protein HOK021_21970 [Streptomyces hygroscopicus]
MVGACIMPCGAPAAQGAVVRGVESRPVRRGVPGRTVRPAGAAEERAPVALLWRPDSDRRACLSVLDST